MTFEMVSAFVTGLGIGFVLGCAFQAIWNAVMWR
jgi:hypothetical protein